MTEVETKEKGSFLMSPKVDFCFKELMRNSEVRKGFLSAVLEIPPEEIRETTLLPTHLQKEQEKDKLGILDVQVRMQDGTKVDIEVNVAPFVAWPERSLFYLGKMYVGQIEKGGQYRSLKKCVHIGILDFVLFEGEESYYSRFHLWEDERKLKYSDKLEIHICELPKLRECAHPETELLNWMRFINAEKEEEMEEMAERNGYIQTAYDDLKMLSADEQKRLAYEERLKAERDYASLVYENWERGKKEGLRQGVESGIRQGIQTGIKQGMQTGIKQGMQTKTVQVVLRLLDKGFSPEETAEMSGESLSVVRNICEWHQKCPEMPEEEIAKKILNL